MYGVRFEARPHIGEEPVLARFCTILVIGAIVSGCTEPKSGDDILAPDSEVIDPGPDDSGVAVTDAAVPDEDGGLVTPDAGLPDAAAPGRTAAQSTGGGGRAASADFRARIVVGAPTPMGTAASADYRALIGPGAAQAGQ